MKILFNLIFILASQIVLADTLDEVRQYIQNRLHPEQATVVNHCGFSMQIELQQHLHELSPEMQSAAKTLLLRPTRQKTYKSPYGYFIFHYDTSGVHKISTTDSQDNGVPDYVDSAAVYFNRTWEIEIDSLKFIPPPDSLGNQATEYHIYFSNLGNGGYGVTWFNPSEDIPDLPGDNFASYIEVHNNFIGSKFHTQGLEGLKVTAAHEFGHAIQLGYRFRNEDIFFLEMTSTWLEDYVYNDVNDYLGYLSDFLSNIYGKKFTSFDRNSEYANSIYLHMLEKEYNAEAVVDIWERIISKSALIALDDYLQSKTSSFALSQNLYASWLYFTGDRAQEGHYFPEAADYPMLTPYNGIDAIEQYLEPLKMRHVYLGVEPDHEYRVNIQADTNNGVFNHICYGAPLQTPHPFGSPQVFWQTGSDSLVVALTNPTSETIDSIKYSIELNSESTKKEPIYVHVKYDGALFRNLPSHSTITIFTINGLHIRTVYPGLNNVHEAEWDLTDRFGDKVASGIYLYYVNGDGSPELGKFAIVR